MNQTKRILELDLMKTFIIIVPMIGIHCMYDLSLLSTDDGVFEGILNIIASPFCAPMFMFCMGVTLGVSRHQNPKDYLRRGVKLITCGMLLNLLRYLPTAYSAAKAGETDIFCAWAQVFNVDILQFAGLSFMLLALLRKLNARIWVICLVGVLLNIAGTLLDGVYADSYVVNQILGYFYPTPSCCCFPLMNWFIFVAAGNAMGWIYQNRDTGRFLRIAAPAGAIITALYLYLCIEVEAPFTRVLQDDWGFYSMHTPDALFTIIGIAPFMLGFFRILSKAVPQKCHQVLYYPSRHINQFYCVSWVWIMWTANLFLFVPKATTLEGFLLIWFFIEMLTAITVIIYNRYLETGLKAFFSRRSKAWIITIWAALILFGIWFFSTVPGPYTRPY